MLTLFDSKYWDYTPKHFHEKLVEHHGFTQSYLATSGWPWPDPARPPTWSSRRKRPRRPMVGMIPPDAS
ncbi:hypothetical protein [Tateyamaria sp.]|uniref:hypothetical protein n=1 Tax=Tateyamaria sp. TaxID=1929288 RepID=UPI003B225446